MNDPYAVTLNRDAWNETIIGGWRPWFAWRPVRVENRWVWLTTILRRETRKKEWCAAITGAQTYRYVSTYRYRLRKPNPAPLRKSEIEHAGRARL